MESVKRSRAGFLFISDVFFWSYFTTGKESADHKKINLVIEFRTLENSKEFQNGILKKLFPGKYSISKKIPGILALETIGNELWNLKSNIYLEIVFNWEIWKKFKRKRP